MLSRVVMEGVENRSGELDALEAAFRRILPSGFGLGVAGLPDGEAYEVPPGEAACLSGRAIHKRRATFAMGRAAAHRALAEIGVSAAAVGKGGRGEPLWPEGIVGSIAHKDRAAVAVAAPSDLAAGVGVDLEDRFEPLEGYTFRRIARPEELPWAQEAGELAVERVRMLFSAKEAVYKAANAALLAYPGFQDIAFAWDEPKSGFMGKILPRPGLHMPGALDLFTPLIRTDHYIGAFYKLPPGLEPAPEAIAAQRKKGREA